MLNRKLLSALCTAGLVATAAGCDSSEPVTDDTMLAVAVTGPGFFFYPPFGTMTTAPTEWEPRVYERLSMSIDELDASGSPARHLRTMSSVTTPRIVLHSPAEGFGVGWNSNADDIRDGRVYRITVSVDGRELGHADIDPIYNSHIRTKSQLWIKFRVERTAVDQNNDGVLDWDDRCVGGVDCDDNDPCTEDSCAPATGCVHANAPDGPFEGSGNTTCGTGACSATGSAVCVNGAVQDSCTPGQAAASDTSCNNTDEDCDGRSDEDYVPASVTCGSYANAPVVQTSCVNGVVQENCPTPNACTAAAITTYGTAMTRSNQTAGASLNWEVCGTAGQRISLNVNFTDVCLRVSVISPVGVVMVNNSTQCGSSFIETMTLPVSGAYTIRLTPTSNVVGNGTLTVYDVPADIHVNATLGAPRAPSLALSVPGQDGRVIFANNTVGQRASINVARSTGCFRVSLLAPSGTAVIAPNLQCGTWFSELQLLNEVGNYALVLDGYSSDRPTFTTDLYIVPADLSQSGVIGGANVVSATTVPAQNASVSFSGSAGQRTAFQIARSTGCFNLRLTAPSGAVVIPTRLECGTYFSELVVLNESGAYTWLLDGYSSDTPTYTMTSWIVPADLALSSSVGGGAVSLPLTTPSQVGTVTFNGTAGQRTSIGVTRTSGCFRITVTAPSGARPVNATLECGNYFSDLLVLAETGAYAVLVDPYTTDTATYTANIYGVPADLSVSSSIGGGAASLPFTMPAQNGFVTFSANSGQRITINVQRSTGCLRRSLTSPSGANLFGPTLTCSSSTNNTLTLAESGTFTYFVNPDGADVPNVTVTITPL